MSKLHLDAFLNDVKGINPQFRASTSSLKGLITHLQANISHPVPMSEQKAVQLCSNFRAGRIDKYSPAIKRLVGVWGQPSRPYPQATRGTLLSEVEINRICFRGDARAPDKIFTTGFAKVEQDMPATYRSGTVEAVAGAPNPVIDRIIGLKKAGDLVPASAVCVTPDMHVAALFPLPMITVLNDFKPTEVDTWIYMTYVAKGIHTHGRQVLDALAGLDALSEITPEKIGKYSPDEVNSARVDAIMQNLYGHEMATDNIAQASIFYGFRIQRKWNKTTKRTSSTFQGPVVGYEGDYKAGGFYKILEVRKNPNAVYPPNTNWESVVSSLAEDIKKNLPTFLMPTYTAGFKPSNVRALASEL